MKSMIGVQLDRGLASIKREVASAPAPLSVTQG